MPKSKLQNFFFTVGMVVLMVFSMTVYNLAFEMHGLIYPAFLIALKEMWVEVVFAVIVEILIAGPIARKIAFRYKEFENSPTVQWLLILTFTVVIMCVFMCLFATFMHFGFNGSWFTTFLTMYIRSFPMALFWSALVVEPVVKNIFKAIAKN
ncbi:MAG: DUF2798 domain-containing protein [Ruminococcus flavefaciens]|nr:DUF2798 domain-containing protein [Ruminococcus flavefaciens]